MTDTVIYIMPRTHNYAACHIKTTQSTGNREELEMSFVAATFNLPVNVPLLIPRLAVNVIN